MYVHRQPNCQCLKVTFRSVASSRHRRSGCPSCWNLLSSMAATGGAEVDVIFETTRLVFSRWQIQCKNTASVSLDDVAKEVGLTHFLKSNVIVMVSTGIIGPEARRYSNKIMTDSNLCIIMIDREDIGRIVQNPTVIADIFAREADHAMKIKILDI